jgi:hypothetical protein
MRRRKVGARKTYERTCVVRTRHVRHIYMLDVYVHIRVAYAQRKERAFAASKNGRMTDGQRRNQTHFDFCVKQRTRRTWYERAAHAV